MDLEEEHDKDKDEPAKKKKKWNPEKLRVCYFKRYFLICISCLYTREEKGCLCLIFALFRRKVKNGHVRHRHTGMRWKA